MGRKSCTAMLLLCTSLAAFAAHAEDAPAGEKQVAGMSILGNDEAPKSLVIVPWKSSDLGSALAVAKGLDAGREPVDKRVFVRAVDYYEIRAAESK
ncbi:MAG: hypothetical protein R3F35_22325 [Myxococcota bacterium]